MDGRWGMMLAVVATKLGMGAAGVQQVEPESACRHPEGQHSPSRMAMSWSHSGTPLSSQRTS